MIHTYGEYFSGKETEIIVQKHVALKSITFVTKDFSMRIELSHHEEKKLSSSLMSINPHLGSICDIGFTEKRIMHHVESIREKEKPDMEMHPANDLTNWCFIYFR